MAREPDTILNLKQLSEAMGLDPRTLRMIADQLGGKRVGRRLLFRWGTVMEYFNANTAEKNGECVASASIRGRKADSQQDFSERKKGRARMEGSKRMGRTAKNAIPCGGEDPFGLRSALDLGRGLS